MGCVSSKPLKKQLRQEILFDNGRGGGGEYVVNHVVSLTSSTYGVLQLDAEKKEQREEKKEEEVPGKEIVAETKKKVQKSPPRGEPEVINAWELMEGLEEEIPISNQPKKSPKTRVLLRGFADMEARSPLKFFNQFGSPRKMKKYGGKENKVRVNGVFTCPVKSDFSPKPVFRVNNHQDKSCKKVLNLNIPVKTEGLGGVSELSSRRRSFSPLFDPELIANYEKELSEEEEQIKRIISPTFSNRNSRHSPASALRHFGKKCPPGGENAVVIYTTTLRGIRKTFEDCNKVRSIIESHQIQMFERDISMDSGLKEELRGLMETKEVKVPLLFVKGRLIGGVDEVMKLEEEGKLEILFDGIPKAIGGCEGCAGVRFMMCMECNGSCKVLDQEQKKMVKCGECNENGLIQCPICC
ncbi:Glutaredoxin [Melia azedarach]|uniref:Glutaredoxin n=1 Tax=Melia azedarach TaxID=155640 RepID=A0ACC1X4Z9_MELAZ|nr:Glutaredoxin [Melia azedarach]